MANVRIVLMDNSSMFGMAPLGRTGADGGDRDRRFMVGGGGGEAGKTELSDIC